MSDDFFSFCGIDFGVAEPVVFRQGAFTSEVFMETVDRMLANYGGPRHEFHAPTCPKILTQGVRACRCGTAPLEAWCEDDMEFSWMVRRTSSGGRTWSRFGPRRRRRKAGTKERTRKRR